MVTYRDIYSYVCVYVAMYNSFYSVSWEGLREITPQWEWAQILVSKTILQQKELALGEMADSSSEAGNT